MAATPQGQMEQQILVAVAVAVVVTRSAFRGEATAALVL